MKIIFYHGFNSSKKSSKYTALESYCNERGYELFCDEVDHKNSKDTIKTHTNRLLECMESNDEIVLVGHSLGGFYARYFGKLFGLKALIINPCLNPGSVDKSLHTIVNECTPSNLSRTLIVSLVDMNDEVLDMDNASRVLEKEGQVVKFYGSGHRFDDNLDKISVYLDELINTYVI